MNWTEEAVLEALKGVLDPELGKDVVTLGWVKVNAVSEGQVDVTVKTGNPAMHARQRVEEAVQFALERAFGTDAQFAIAVEGVKAEERTPETRKVLPGVKHVIAIASGKEEWAKAPSRPTSLWAWPSSATSGALRCRHPQAGVPTMFDVSEASPNQSPLRKYADSTRRTVRRQGPVHWVLRRPRPGHCLARSDGQPGFGSAVH